jgi:hypothetical protein
MMNVPPPSPSHLIVSLGTRLAVMDAAGRWMEDGRTFVYQSDLDRNGLLFWLGTEGKTKDYTNPHTAGSVVVTPSSVGFGGAAGFIEHRGIGSVNCTRSVQGSTVSVQLPAGFIVSHYTIRHGSFDGSSMRNWNLEASRNGAAWTLLREHAYDTGLLRTAFSTCSWAVDTEGQAFTHFRLHQTGVNLAGNHFLMLGGLELYGQCGGSGGVAHGMVMPPTLPVLGWVATTHPDHLPRTDFQMSHSLPATTTHHPHTDPSGGDDGRDCSSTRSTRGASRAGPRPT